MAPKEAAAETAGSPIPGSEALTGEKGGEAAGSAGEAGGKTQAAPSPALVTVLVGGKQHQVPPEVAQSILQEQDAFRRERVDRTRRPTTDADSRADERPQKPPWHLATDNYKEYDEQYSSWLDRRFLDLEERIEKRRDERDSKAQERRDVKELIDRVAAKSTALAGEDDLILKSIHRVVARSPYPIYTSDPRTLDLVLEEASAELTRLANKAKSHAPKPPSVERQGGVGGIGAGERAAPTEERRGPISIADIQRERRLRRMKGARGGSRQEV